MLRCVHGGVGPFHQLLPDLLGVAGEADADTRRDLDRGVIDHERRRERLLDAVGQADRVGGRFEVFAHDDELVSAQTRQRVRRPHARVQSLGHRHEQRIADVVTVGVVDPLEPVEVHEEERDLPPRAVDPRSGKFEALVQHESVGQAGQRVL